MEKVIEIDYTPRECFLPYHDTDKRFCLTVAHRRAGKTVARINKLIRAAAVCDRNSPRFGYLAPYYIQAKDIAWAYLKEYARPILELGGKINESELSVTFAHNGANIRLYGAENAERLRGLYFDGMAVDEAQDIPKHVLTQIIYPALADRQGWLDLSGTPKGWGNLLGETYKLAQQDDEWFHQVLRYDQTGILPEDEIARLRRSMSQEEFAQEFECSFDAAIRGAYYAEYIRKAEEENRVTTVPLDAMLPVNTAWDLGMGDSTAIWVYQRSPIGQIRILDYIENHGVGLSWYVNALKERASKHDWTFGQHTLPHDVAVRELGTGRSRHDMLVEMGLRPTVAPKLSVDDGINAVRVALPMMWFDKNPAVMQGLECLRTYRREFDAKRQVFFDKPLHSYESHAADSMRYLCVGIKNEPSNVPLKRGLRGII